MSENVGASTSRNFKGLHGLYRENITFPSFVIKRGVLEGESASENSVFFLEISMIQGKTLTMMHLRKNS
jgi:hypothetical protein